MKTRIRDDAYTRSSRGALGHDVRSDGSPERVRLLQREAQWLIA